MNFTHSVLSSLSEIRNFKQNWIDLHNNCKNKSIYNSFSFIINSISNFKDSTLKNHIIAIYLNHQLIAIFPFQLYIERRYFFNFKILEYSAQDEIDKPSPVIKQQHEDLAWTGLFEFLNNNRSSWDILILMEVNEFNHEIPLTKEFSKLSNYPYNIKPDKSGPIIQLDKPWDMFWSSHKKMRKKIHKIESNYKDKLVFKVNHDSWEILLDEYIALESRSWKTGKVGISKDQETIAFYKDLFEDFSCSKQLHFGFLYINDFLISAEIAYSMDDKVYFCHGCYDQEFRKYSPGMVSTSYFIKHFMNGEYTTGDFLCGYSGYLNAWSESESKTHLIEVHNRSFNTGILFIYRAFKYKLFSTFRLKIKPE